MVPVFLVDQAIVPWRDDRYQKGPAGVGAASPFREDPVRIHRPRHAAAPGGTRLHIREDPGLSVNAGDGVLGTLTQCAPGRIRTCAHGSGVIAPIKPGTPSDLCGS
ncbi:hypothetical protein GCM10010308_54830 [Streptomyces vinaceusdrappus]|nr:hypothetical protein GCM10010301_00930 [Streptomyces plicatus]GHC30238.1 hypothetical protein GCM10010308_54830 [Streptomyces vinaceusdrappus]